MASGLAKTLNYPISAVLLQEDIPLIKTENGLCRNLNDQDLTAPINEQLLRLAAGKIDDNMVLALDPGDNRKPYAKSMELLCGIYDGSIGEPARGYHLCQVSAANWDITNLCPYIVRLIHQMSQIMKATDKLRTVVSTVKARIGAKGV